MSTLFCMRRLNCYIVVETAIMKETVMIKETVVVKNPTGLHARPATMLAKLAGRYNSNIELIYNDKPIKLKMMQILSAGIKGGSELQIVCDGDDEQQAMQEIKELFENSFGE